MTQRIRTVLLAVTFHWLTPTPCAWAEPSFDAERAETYSRIGMKLARQQRFSDALIEFRRAEELIEHIEAPGVLYGNIGYCLTQLERPVEALAAFEAGLGYAKTDEIRARLSGNVERLRLQLFARLDVQCDAGRVVVHVPGLEPRACPATWKQLRTGRYLVEGRTETGLSAVAEVDLAAGEREVVALKLPSGLRLESSEPARVWLDGAPVGTTPFETNRLPAGEHTVSVSTAEGAEWQAQVNAKPGEWLTLMATPEAPAAPRRVTSNAERDDNDVWLLTGLGVGAAIAVGVGAYLLLSTPEPTPSAFATE